jgi:hypothetical protein
MMILAYIREDMVLYAIVIYFGAIYKEFAVFSHFNAVLFKFKSSSHYLYDLKFKNIA